MRAERKEQECEAPTLNEFSFCLPEADILFLDKGVVYIDHTLHAVARECHQKEAESSQILEERCGFYGEKAI